MSISGAEVDTGTLYRALVEYDGAAYHGFQRQREPDTIQETLERAISAIASQPIRIVGAGRTDSGVHASGQVISFRLKWRHGLAALQRAMNANLPADIAVLSVEAANPAFHPRYSALRRAYEYHIYSAPLRSPLRRLRSWHVSGPLDMEKMNQAAASLIGVHDFATFGQPPQGDKTIREVFRAEWRRQSELMIFTIEANAFLYRMVRSLVGSLKAVGEGAWTVEKFIAALEARNRSHAGASAPPHALYLVSVSYE